MVLQEKEKVPWHFVIMASKERVSSNIPQHPVGNNPYRNERQRKTRDR
jgi:hypothetical protein